MYNVNAVSAAVNKLGRIAFGLFRGRHSGREERRNLPEQFPVNTLLRRAGAAYKHYGANLAVLRADR
jgi:hypothetical protein